MRPLARQPLAAALVVHAGLRTAAAAPSSLPAPELRLPFTLVDVPDMTRGVVPSMHQSLDLTYAVDRLALHGIRSAAYAMFPEDHQAGARQGVGLAMAYGTSGLLVFFNAFTHEEWHRAVLSRREVSSRNGWFHPEAWRGGAISVDHVSDTDLAQLKREHPADYVRLPMAGMESTAAFVDRLHSQRFLRGHDGHWWKGVYFGDSYTAPLVQVQLALDLSYHLRCNTDSGDAFTDQRTLEDVDPDLRDFTGLDCNAWAYDLQRPDEPYEARGPHPTGPGIDRYRSRSDLTAEEQVWLRRATRLQSLHLLDPQLFGIDAFSAGQGRRFMVAASPAITPFGVSYGVRAAYSENPSTPQPLSVRGTVRVHQSATLVLPEVSATVQKAVVPAVVLEGLGAVWLQPEDLRFDAERGQLGGRLAMTGRWLATPHFDIWATIDGKSAGYQLGVIDLDAAVTGRLGVGWSVGP